MKKIGIRVGDIMTRDFISVSPNTPIIECAKKMITKHTGSLILVEKENLKGIVTRKDIIWAFLKKSKSELEKIPAINISPRKLATIRPDADLLESLKRMRKTKFKRLPVVVKNRIIGLLTMKDIIRIQPDLFDIASAHNMLEIREENQKLKRVESPKEFSVGICEECGNNDILYRVDGKLMCESCMEEM